MAGRTFTSDWLVTLTSDGDLDTGVGDGGTTATNHVGGNAEETVGAIGLHSSGKVLVRRVVTTRPSGNGGVAVDRHLSNTPPTVTVSGGGACPGDDGAEVRLTVDDLDGSATTDVVIGRQGNDTNGGCGGADVLRGGLGNDTLDGGDGDDHLDGGRATTTFPEGRATTPSAGGPGIDLASGAELFRRPDAAPAEGGQLTFDGTSVAVGNFYDGQATVFEVATGAERTIDAHGIIP